MATLTVTGQVDDQHRLIVDVPDTFPPGAVTVRITPVVDEDDAGAAWMEGVSREWADVLGDPREDIYDLTDGEPLSGA